jgi:MerR family redox-sensitive transcriptional activator SoxR
MPSDLLTIGELARRTGRRASSIRYYEKIGLLPEPIRISGQRRYREDVLRLLSVVDTAQAAGLTLEEIKPLLEAEPGDGAVIEELRQIAVRKLPQVAAMIERAQLVHRWLEAAARCECPSLEECCLFADGERFAARAEEGNSRFPLATAGQSQ